MNTQGTDGGSVTVGLPSFEMEDTRRSLIALRVKHGANTPIGHRCSTLIEQMQSLEGSGPAQRAALTRLMPKAMAELAELIKAA